MPIPIPGEEPTKPQKAVSTPSPSPNPNPSPNAYASEYAVYQQQGYASPMVRTGAMSGPPTQATPPTPTAPTINPYAAEYGVFAEQGYAVPVNRREDLLAMGGVPSGSPPTSVIGPNPTARYQNPGVNPEIAENLSMAGFTDIASVFSLAAQGYFNLGYAISHGGQRPAPLTGPTEEQYAVDVAAYNKSVSAFSASLSGFSKNAQGQYEIPASEYASIAAQQSMLQGQYNTLQAESGHLTVMAFGQKVSPLAGEVGQTAAYIVPGGAILHGWGDTSESVYSRVFDIGVGSLYFIPGLGTAIGAATKVGTATEPGLSETASFLARTGIGAGIGTAISAGGTALAGGSPAQVIEAGVFGAVIGGGASAVVSALKGFGGEPPIKEEGAPPVGGAGLIKAIDADVSTGVPIPRGIDMPEGARFVNPQLEVGAIRSTWDFTPAKTVLNEESMVTDVANPVQPPRDISDFIQEIEGGKPVYHGPTEIMEQGAAPEGVKVAPKFQPLVRPMPEEPIKIPGSELTLKEGGENLVSVGYNPVSLEITPEVNPGETVRYAGWAENRDIIRATETQLPTEPAESTTTTSAGQSQTLTMTKTAETAGQQQVGFNPVRYRDLYAEPGETLATEYIPTPPGYVVPGQAASFAQPPSNRGPFAATENIPGTTSGSRPYSIEELRQSAFQHTTPKVSTTPSTTELQTVTAPPHSAIEINTRGRYRIPTGGETTGTRTKKTPTPSTVTNTKLTQTQKTTLETVPGLTVIQPLAPPVYPGQPSETPTRTPPIALPAFPLSPITMPTRGGKAGSAFSFGRLKHPVGLIGEGLEGTPRRRRKKE